MVAACLIKMPVPVPPAGQDRAPTDRKVTAQSEYISAVVRNRPIRAEPPIMVLK